jgi:hypothetical protein
VDILLFVRSVPPVFTEVSKLLLLLALVSPRSNLPVGEFQGFLDRPTEQVRIGLIDVHQLAGLEQTQRQTDRRFLKQYTVKILRQICSHGDLAPGS